MFLCYREKRLSGLVMLCEAERSYGIVEGREHKHDVAMWTECCMGCVLVNVVQKNNGFLQSE